MTTERTSIIRPLLYSRLRLYLGGQAEYLAIVLDEELETSYRELEALRAKERASKAKEDSPEAAEIMSEIEELKDEIIHIINARRDITTGLLDDRMDFLKIRVYRGGMADTLTGILQDRQSTLLDHLAGLRAAGKSEDDEEIGVTRDRLVWISNLLRELGIAAIDLAGPDADPR